MARPGASRRRGALSSVSCDRRETAAAPRARPLVRLASQTYCSKKNKRMVDRAKPTGPIVLSEDGTRKFKGTVTRIIDAFFIVDDDCYCSRTLLPPVRRRA